MSATSTPPISVGQRHGLVARATWTLLVALLTTSATAQPVPAVKSVTPDAVQRGKTVTLTLTGDNLAGASQAVVAGPAGVSAAVKPAGPATKPMNTVTIDVTAASDAPRGLRELRLVTPHGVTRPVLLSVDDLPAATEKEPNNSPGEAQVVALPAVLTGRIQADLDVDCFAFDATKGQRLIFDVQAFRTGSKLDASLTLLDSAGRRVARDEDTNGLDPLIDFTVPADGRYVLRVQDLQFKGGGDFTYRVRAGEIPYVDTVFPLGGRRGEQVAVQLKGRNLPAAATMNMALDAADPAPVRQLEAPTPAGPTNSVPFAVSDLPEVTESAASAVLSAPVVVNGRIGKPNEADAFRFKSAAAGPVVLEVAAARFGSRLDALLTLVDEKGTVIQRNDDAAGVDARLQFTAERDKVYQAIVRDLTDAGGEAYGYRLSIAPPRVERPDFDVVLRSEPEVRLNRGGRTALRAEVTRRGGFKSDVTVALFPLPPGVTCKPLVVSATQPSSGVFTLAATDDAPQGFYPLGVVATAAVGDEVVAKAAAPHPKLGSTPQAYLTVHEAAPVHVERLGPPAESDPKVRAEKVAALEKALGTPTPALEAAQAKWEKTFDPAAAWEVVDVLSAKASSSVPLVKQADGSVRPEGRVPSVDKYTVVAKVASGGVKRIRLEAISEGTVGPGRAPNGNFVLSTFKVGAVPAGSTDAGAATPLELASAKASFNQDGFDVATTIGGSPGAGWAVSPEFGKSHFAVYKLAAPALPAGGGTLAFTLDHSSPHVQHLLGRFRLLVASADKPDDAVKIPTGLPAVLKTPADQRTAEQKQALGAFYRSVAPELAKARDELAALRTSGAVFPPTVAAGGAGKVDLLLARVPGFAGDVTLTLEGFSTGVDDKTKEPATFGKNFDFTPVTLKAGQSAGVLEFRAKPNAEKGTRDAVVRAETMVNGWRYVVYSRTFPVTVK